MPHSVTDTPDRISVCIPAHNEEKFIGACLESIARAAEEIRPIIVETIVSLNRCTDRTEAIARSYGATIVKENAKNIAKIMNAGVRAARGEIVVTIDADSRMSPNMLAQIVRLLDTDEYIGGGVSIKWERWSLGIAITNFFLIVLLGMFQVSAGLFWLRKKDLDAIGGFNESLISAQDLDFARRLKAYGRKNARRFKTISDAHIETSCRKFDTFGDWHILLRTRFTLRLMSGRHRETADAYYYHPGR